MHLGTQNLKLLGHCLANRMVLMLEHKAAYIYLTKKEDYTQFGISEETQKALSIIC